MQVPLTTKRSASEMKYGFKQQAERQAMALRAKLGYRGIDPFPARRLAGHLEYQVTRSDKIPDLQHEIARTVSSPECGWSAMVLTAPDVRLIVYNPSESPARQESSLMHEMAHLLCGHPNTAFDLGGGLLLRRFDKEYEDEAAWLGGCLQLPREVLRAALRRRMTLEQIAEHFAASMQMVRFRYKITGLQRQMR